MNRYCRQSDPRGFTFIEMVAALSIIMIVAGMLFPVFARARESARRTNCRSNLHQLGQALHLYAQDYDGRFPPVDNEWSSQNRYTKNSQVYACPSEPESLRKRYQVGVQIPQGVSDYKVNSSYQYLAGFSNDGWSAQPVARDWDTWHRGGVNVLYLGGHVKWLERRDVPVVSEGSRPDPAKPSGRPAAPPASTEEGE
jgi:prepilin-type processing-associated H-X9-DG protein/prepilin-type N-terminal cleavage/methylation domain-containing protein